MIKLLKTSHDYEHRGQQTGGENAEAPTAQQLTGNGAGAAHTFHCRSQGRFALCRLNTKVPRGSEWDVDRVRSRTGTESPLVEEGSRQL